MIGLSGCQTKLSGCYDCKICGVTWAHWDYISYVIDVDGRLLGLSGLVRRLTNFINDYNLGKK